MTAFNLATGYVPVYCGKPGCDVQFAMTDQFYREMLNTQRTWYCPNGHPRVYQGQSAEAKLEAANAQLVAKQDQLEAAVREAEQVRVALLRDRQRFANGVCPCCNRSFDNVRRHMATKHPDYDATVVTQHQARRFQCSCGSAFESLRGLRTHQGHMRRPGWENPVTSKYRAHLTRV